MTIALGITKAQSTGTSNQQVHSVKALTAKADTGGISHSTADGELGRSYRTREGGTPFAGRAVLGALRDRASGFA